MMQPFNLAYDNFLGRLAFVRIYQGVVKTGRCGICKKANGRGASRQDH
jgi:predicted membrane GTPase involved in stress response